MKISGRIQLGCTVLLTSFFAAIAGSPAWAWGCKGHQIVALIAERHLNPHARAMVMQILAASAAASDDKPKRAAVSAPTFSVAAKPPVANRIPRLSGLVIPLTASASAF
jgi:hypothetical protein